MPDFSFSTELPFVCRIASLVDSQDSQIEPWFDAFVGLIAGAIDSVAGGGGLITVPTLALALGPGQTAIGTNKIVGLTSSAIALFVYARKGHVEWRRSISFAALAAVGSLVGSRASFLVPPEAYRWILAAAAPLVLWIVWEKDLWVRRSSGHDGAQEPEPSTSRIAVAALVSGFYDGIAGPGGGTLMFLSLFLFARQSILAAIASAKLANLASAGAALASYAQAGAVRWEKGAAMAAGIGAGAFIGATFASQEATKWARWALTAVALLLALRLLA